VISLEEGVPEWARTLATLALGAGGAKMLAVWLENRRLSQKEYRDTLLSRIEDLESCVAGLQTRVGSLRVEIAHLEERLRGEEDDVERLQRENDELRSRLDDPDPLA
jgi:predicted nuclease with TOPRIM domain